jgi:hypothetical protein
MDWILIIGLILIVVALGSIKEALDKIANRIADNSNEIAQKPVASASNLSGVEEQLENLFKVMGGEAKMKDEKTKKRKDLYERYVKALILRGNPAGVAKTEADKKFEEAEFNVTHDRSVIDYSSGLYDVESWVIAVEVEDRNNKKYGSLLPKAREYLKDKKTIKPNEMKLGEALKTDYKGVEWLIQKLIQEKKLKRVTKYNPDGADFLEHYEVLEAEK